jgi:hypothetical protein
MSNNNIKTININDDLINVNNKNPNENVNNDILSSDSDTDNDTDNDSNMESDEEETTEQLSVDNNDSSNEYSDVESEDTEDASDMESEDTEDASDMESEDIEQDSHDVEKIEINKNSIFFRQEQIRNSDVYKNYENTIETFFRKKRKTDNFIRMIKNDMYLMINKNNKDNITTIIPPKIVNIYKYYYDKNQEKNIIYNEISNLISETKNDNGNSQKFNEFKEKLELIKNETDNIKALLNKQKNIVNDLTKSKTEYLFNLSKMFFERNILYKKIERNKINNNQIKKIMNIYKENNYQIPEDGFLKTLVDELKIDFFNIKNVLSWIDISKKYVELQSEIFKLKKELEEKKKLFANINNNFILSMPEVKQNKNLNINIKVPEKKINNENKVKLIKLNETNNV